MFYDLELRFLQSVLNKCRLRAFLTNSCELPKERAEASLHRELGFEYDYAQFFGVLMRMIEPKIIYRLVDKLSCHYMFFELPDTVQRQVMVIGPFLQEEIDRQQILEQMERLDIAPQRYRQIETYYAAIPVLPDASPVFALIDTFAEKIWGAGAYNTINVNHEILNATSPVQRTEGALPQDENQQNVRMMEQRYAYENELMQAVSMGQAQKVEMMMNAFTALAFESRLQDPVRNMKNYGIIMNTLFRKAAEQGGVHPIYLDSISSGFARKIERVTSVSAIQRLMLEMAHSYCRLVKRHSTKEYSLPVQKAVLQIDADLSADLSLKALADGQNINASYLSALFKKETGQTVTDYVNQRRVRYALQLLATTKLQVQTVAQHCGIPDINYFSKIFKKYTLTTPKEYRKGLLVQVDAKKEH